jgi:uncharacterized protein (TIGR02145 family)
MFFVEDIDSINFIPSSAVVLPLGTYSWMKANLDVEFYRNGDPIPQVTDASEWLNLKTGAWCYINNDSELGKKYGKLYNWYAVNDPRGLAPLGSHIPHSSEWNDLSEYLGGDYVAGGNLKSTGTIEDGNGLWKSPNTGATNMSNFSAQPAGFRYDAFSKIGENAIFWSSSEYDDKNVYVNKLSYDTSAIVQVVGKKGCGFSVRCVMDYTLPVISSIEPSTFMVNEIITIFGSGFGEKRGTNFVSFNFLTPAGIDYQLWSDTEIRVIVPKDAESGKIYVSINGLKSSGVEYTIYEQDPNLFEPIVIGDQTWMSRNLNVSLYRNGDTIPQVTDLEEWKKLKTGAWCYYENNAKNQSIYGKLYNWYAVNDPRGLAPEGWHVPRQEEWTLLMDFLGGSTEAGGKMKQTGTSKEHTGLWKAPNWGATNESRFTALPAGGREENYFSGIGTTAYWWTASELDIDEADSKIIGFMEAACISFSNKKYYGYAVRCIKD